MWQDLNAWIVGEWAVISSAPGAFLAAMAAGWFVIWKIVQWQHGIKVANLESSLTLYREQTAFAAATVTRGASAETDASLTPRPPLALNSNDEPQQFLEPDISIETLRQVYANADSIKEKMELDKYIGKWMDVTGQIVSTYYANPSVSVSLKVDSGYSGVIMLFNSSNDEVRSLKVKDYIRARGRLHSVDSLGVAFADCELIATW